MPHTRGLMKCQFLGLLVIATSLAASPALAQTTGSHDQIAQPGTDLATDVLPAVPLSLSTASLPTKQETHVSAATAPVIAMYAAYGVLQALDAHSTLRALDSRGAEGNPFVRPFASSPARLISFKAASTVGVLYLAERLRKKNQIAAVALLIGVNSLQAFVVAHNYRVAGR